MSVTLESNIRVILLDIEGTTTPVNFVYEKLFPYASRNVERFLHDRFQAPEIRAAIDELRALSQQDKRQGLQPPLWNNATKEAGLDSSVAYARWLIARDSKCTPFKTLQGKIWQEGYARGELRGEVYEDVPRAFRRWWQQGRQICIYSSGSVLAQQLLFRTTNFGDLTRYISGFFDTQVGAKNESESYRKMAASVGQAPAKVLFISDAMKEVEAARDAEMQTMLCQRDADSHISAMKHPVIRTFDEVFPD